MGSRLITARVRDLTFTTIYVPNGKRLEHEDYGKKLAWFDDLATYCATPDESTVVCGDFNLCPAPLDSWNEDLFGGTVHHTTAERDRFRRLLDLGFVDIFREHHPDARAFSWWDYRGGAFHRKQGLRIDFLLATPAVADRVLTVEIDRDYRKKQEGLVASDHAPVIADLAEPDS
jgi:exodeoxyribonuclease-3